MSDLTEFLLARIAEDEETANAEIAFAVDWPERSGGFGQITPARVLAEVEAKRRIVEWHVKESEERARWGDGDTCCEDRYGSIVMLPPDEHTLSAGSTFGGGLSITESFATQVRYGCVTLMMLANVYSDHPDYDEAWRA